MPESGQVVFALVRTTPSGNRLLGTAFALGGRRLATCLHVVDGDDRGLNLVMPRDPFDGYQDATNGEYRVQEVLIEQVDPVHDLAILLFKDEATSVKVNYKLGSTDSVSVGDNVNALGYPHLDSNRLVLTQYETTVGARVLLGNKGIASKHLVLNTMLHSGQSGGPVGHQKTQSIVGIVVGSYSASRISGGGILIGSVDPTAINQTGHAVSAEYLRAMV